MAMPPHARAADGLLLFCDFIAHRLYTENLELLRRIVVELHAKPRSSSTIKALLAIGYPTVTVLPVTNDDPVAVAYAHGLLGRVRVSEKSPLDASAMRNLFVALHDQLELTNWHWLVAMYRDFCTGDETTIKEFVSRSSAAISMFPVAPLQAAETEDAIMISDSDDGIDSGVEVEPEPLVSPLYSEEDELSQSSVDSIDAANVTEIIHQTQQQAEASRPWTHIFDVTKIVYPFDAKAYPKLANNLSAFWERHAYAVWERNFWSPLRELPSAMFFRRKHRQRAATEAFVSHVVLPVFETFGAEFFLALDAQKDHLYWWWYRAPVVDLEKMSRTVGIDACLKYIPAQANKREPTLPRGFTNHTPGYQSQTSVSMWSTMVRTTHVVDEIERLIA